jgi:hypothetical protein
MHSLHTQYQQKKQSRQRLLLLEVRAKSDPTWLANTLPMADFQGLFASLPHCQPICNRIASVNAHSCSNIVLRA